MREQRDDFLTPAGETLSFVVEVQVEQGVVENGLAAVALTAAETALQSQAAPPGAALTVLLSTDEQLQRLNREFVGVDAPTDVLSFPAGAAMPEMETYLGDIAISLPRAASQAQEAGHSLVAELQLLVVHGVLHLLGYDHGDAEEKAAMWAAQAVTLRQLGATIQDI